MYLGLAIVIFGLFPLIAWFLRISYFKVFRMVWDLFLIAFSTTSTETILPHVLLATATAVGLPAEGVAIIAGIDRVLDMARTACNTPGHVLACIVVSKWEKEFRQEGWTEHQIRQQTEQRALNRA